MMKKASGVGVMRPSYDERVPRKFWFKMMGDDKVYVAVFID